MYDAIFMYMFVMYTRYVLSPPSRLILVMTPIWMLSFDGLIFSFSSDYNEVLLTMLGAD